MLRVVRNAPKSKVHESCVKASAYDGNRLVGAIVACESLKDSRDIWQVDKINVIEDYQRRGVGTLLYREMADVACEKGVPLASSPRTWRSRASTGFWNKQLAKGRARDIGDGVIVLDQSCGAELSGFKMPEGKQLWFALGGLGVLALLLSKSSSTEYSSTGTGFVNPITGRKLATTGKLAYMFERSGDHTHRGVDIPAPAGTPVRAAANGTVRVATEVYKQGFSGYGAVVVLEHDGVWTLYAHLNSVSVSVGQRVGAGQQIGTVGTTQFFSDDPTRIGKIGAHLHFEVSPRGYPQQSEATRIDPVAWLRSGGASVA